MSWERTIDLSVDIDAAPALVWGRVSDHERTPTWVKRSLRSVRLLEPGAPQRGGAGAVRAVKFAGWPTVQERIVRFDDGSCFEYRVTTGMPHLDDHLGRLSVEPREGGATLRWYVFFAFRPTHPLSWFAPVVVSGFRGVLADGLAELKRQCEHPA